MSITSFSFFFLCLFSFFVCQFTNKNSTKKAFLLLISYYFYMTIDWRFAGILLVLTLVNYFAGHVIKTSVNQQVRRFALSLAIIFSLAVLFYFKYLGFLVESLYELLSGFGLEGRSPFVDIILPIGISFMTFQSITYPLDLYSGKLEKKSSFGDFALFMSFFPQLLSGPIVRASFFMPQLEHNHKGSGQELMEGATLILRGLIKKVVFADMLAVQLVDPAFDDPTSFSSVFLIIALIAYSFQVYMDLSGYTDIAIGVARLFGYRLPINFNRPYQATSIANFWQRWHITMSSFFRDYLYDAIEKAKFGNIYTNLLIVFVAIGIWHGAGLNFVVYGLIHGSLVGWEHFRKQQRDKQGLPPIIYRGVALVTRIAGIFTIIILTRLLFRGDGLSACAQYFQAIYQNFTLVSELPIMALVLLMLSAVLHFSPVRYRDQLMQKMTRTQPLIYAGVYTSVVYILVAFNQDVATFIYYQF
ncbi:MBOAT family O-acyltransferase [Thalassotalea fusca]